MSDDTGYAPIDWHSAAARQHRHNMQLLLTTGGDTAILDDEEPHFLSSVAFNGGTRELASIMRRLQNPGRQPTNSSPRRHGYGPAVAIRAQRHLGR